MISSPRPVFPFNFYLISLPQFAIGFFLDVFSFFGHKLTLHSLANLSKIRITTFNKAINQYQV